MSGNTPYYNLRRKILFEYLEKFKDTPSRSVAKILIKERADLFGTLENARAIVRKYRGVCGSKCRETVKQTKYYKNV